MLKLEISSAINIFSCQRPVTKVNPNGDVETWVVKTFFTTEETFPTVLRRSEVVDIQTAEISPIETALTDVEQKTKELSALNIRYTALAKSSQPVSTNALSMALNSAVDTPINSGISHYRQTFLSPEYLVQNPERSELVQKLRDAIDDQVISFALLHPSLLMHICQVRMIDNCLKLHGALCPSEMFSFHETLERFFRKNFPEELRRLSMDLSPIASSISPASRLPPPFPNSYLHERSRSQTSNTTASRNPFFIPPLQLGRPVVTPPPISPRTLHNHANHEPSIPINKQTPLQRNLAHLARHGFHGVSSGPAETSNSDSISVGSPHGSFVNVGSTIPAASTSGASVTTSNFGNSLGSIKGRFSRLGSLNFGRRDF